MYTYILFTSSKPSNKLSKNIPKLSEYPPKNAPKCSQKHQKQTPKKLQNMSQKSTKHAPPPLTGAFKGIDTVDEDFVLFLFF